VLVDCELVETDSVRAGLWVRETGLVMMDNGVFDDVPGNESDVSVLEFVLDDALLDDDEVSDDEVSDDVGVIKTPWDIFFANMTVLFTTSFIDPTRT
jgi:hypothetical protein